MWENQSDSQKLNATKNTFAININLKTIDYTILKLKTAKSEYEEN